MKYMFLSLFANVFYLHAVTRRSCGQKTHSPIYPDSIHRIPKFTGSCLQTAPVFACHLSWQLQPISNIPVCLICYSLNQSQACSFRNCLCLVCNPQFLTNFLYFPGNLDLTTR